MRARLILALVAVTAACKSKSEDKASPPTGGSQPPGPGAAGSAAPVPADAGVVAIPDPTPFAGGTPKEDPQDRDAKTAPAVPTPVVGGNGFQAQTPRGDTTAERRAPSAAPPASPSAGLPAVPTRATPDDVLAPAPVKPGDGRVVIGLHRGLDDSTLTAEAVTSKIRASYLAGIQRCGGGKPGAVELAFTVGESGRVVAATAPAAFDPRVASCIVGQAKAWVFRVPTSTASMNPAKARFAMTFTLGS